VGQQLVDVYRRACSLPNISYVPCAAVLLSQQDSSGAVVKLLGPCTTCCRHLMAETHPHPTLTCPSPPHQHHLRAHPHPQDSVVEPLLPHFLQFYEADEKLTPPIKLEACARIQVG